MKTTKTLKLTSRGRLALAAMIEIAVHDRDGPVAINRISETNEVSASYMEQLFTGLKSHGLVESQRGPGGGYFLSRPASKITLTEIMLAAEDCPAAKKALPSEHNGTHDPAISSLLDQAGALLYRVFSGVTLDQVVSGKSLNKLLEQAA